MGVRRPPETIELERQILADYKAAWRVVKSALDDLNTEIKVAKRAGVEINRNWLLRQSRLEDTAKLLGRQVEQVNRGIIGAIVVEQNAAGEIAIRDAAELISESIPEDLAFRAALPERAFYQLSRNLSKGKPLTALLQGYGPKAALRARQALTTGLLRGQSPRLIARALRTQMGGNAARALTVARTEVMRSYREAAVDTYRANSDVVSAWEWEAEPDACQFCQDMNGERFPLEDDFATHPNAVLAGSTFAPYGALREMVAARYSGPAVALTVDTETLTIGPNHPMLTSNGWKRAALIREGDKLIHDARLDRSAVAGKPDLEQVPLVEDAFESLSAVGRNHRVAPSADDLHGDGAFCQGEIEVVRAMGRLLVIGDAPFIQHRRECSLVRTDAELFRVASVGPPLTYREAVSLAATRSMSISNPRLAFGWRSAPSPRRVGFGNRARDAQRFGDSSNRTSGDTKRGGDLLRSLARKIEALNGGLVDRWTTATRAIAGVPPSGPARLHVETDAACLALDLDGQPFSLREVTSTKLVWFEGMAYDATTSTGAYASNGYLIKNCRCTPVPVTAE